MKLSLGPVLYYWQRDVMLDFYLQAAAWPVDVVYLGETVCSRRHNLRTDDWLRIAAELRDAGKQVVLSTLTLIESESDLKTMRRLAENGEFLVEANDMGAVHRLSGMPFVAGSQLNVYNPGTLDILAELGACRWVIPLEMSRDKLADLLAHKPENMETEIFVYGRMPLAHSARCFTARHYNKSKDECQFRCLEHPYGLDLETREGKPFLALNGTQTQSTHVYNLLAEVQNMRGMGDVLRISPQPQQTGEVVTLFQAALEGDGTATSKLSSLLPAQACDGYWHGHAGMLASADLAAFME